jgi:glutamate synthase (NADPH/NADH) small chain
MSTPEAPKKGVRRPRTDMPEQAPEVRRTNFEEVPFGYTEALAMEEATRCLQCKNALCRAGCPVQVPIPEFIGLIAKGQFADAACKLKETNALPAVCGRVCPQEDQCEKHCILGKKGTSVAIGNLERFAADWERAHGTAPLPAKKPTNGKRVAVVGSGPSGLTVAGELIKWGFGVTVFEALHVAGGVLVYGIPEFRLPKEIVQSEIDSLLKLGVKLETNFVVGRTATIDELLEEEGFDAVFIGSGAGLPTFMSIPGENSIGVYSANEYLTRSNLMKAYKPGSTTPVLRAERVVTVGGGNVAMDAARTALRMGAQESIIVYRRSREEMPARHAEVHHAEEERIRFELLCNPVEILADDKGFVRGLRCIRMALGEPDASGRRRPVEVPGSEFDIECEVVIIAIGNKPNPLIQHTTPDIGVSKWGTIVAGDADGRTTKARVYAGGDVVTGAATVILAMGAGKTAARSIITDLLGADALNEPPPCADVELSEK